MSTGKVGLDGHLAVIGQQVLQLHPRVERALMDVPDELSRGFPAVGPLIGPLEGGVSAET
jgi:hypothetical protein